MATGLFLDGVTGAATADGLDPTFAANPSEWITRRRAEAKALGLRYMLAQPQGRVPGLYCSNLWSALLPQVRSALCSISEPFGVYTGWPLANDWMGTPTRLDTMPDEGATRLAPFAERRAWAAANVAPLMAMSKLRWIAFDYSQNDPAGLRAVEAYLRRHEEIDVYGELPPTLPGMGNDLLLDTGLMASVPSIGWVGQWSFCFEHKLHYSTVPSGIECHIICIPKFEGGNFQQPVNMPGLADVALAKSRGWTIGVGGGWPVDQAKAILAASVTD